MASNFLHRQALEPLYNIWLSIQEKAVLEDFNLNTFTGVVGKVQKTMSRRGKEGDWAQFSGAR